MAKSKKTVEIPLVRSGAAVESGDVNFTYNNVLIGSLSDSGTAVLKTKDTIVRKDIEVEYTKPGGGGSIENLPVFYGTTIGTATQLTTPMSGNYGDMYTSENIVYTDDIEIGYCEFIDSTGELKSRGFARVDYITDENDTTTHMFFQAPILSPDWYITYEGTPFTPAKLFIKIKQMN